ncbi:MAG: FadR family transcriptional regulator [Thermomicrobiales bacterium]|nr:MAG: FadR family transcriptional regulator [Thermomicrobiales bacterium]
MSFSAVTVVRPYEQIVRQIQDAIRDQALSEGDRLPTERELAETFGVSRSVVREPIKVLSAQGLVESRQGSGLYVRNRPVESVSRAIVLSVSPDLGSVDRLFEFRCMLEVDAARLAAVRASDAQIAAFRQTVGGYRPGPEGEPNWESFASVDNTLHEAIAKAAGNPYLSVMVESVRQLMQDIVVLIADHAGSIDEAMRHHRRIVEAIAQRDSELAAREMDAHVRYSAGVVQIQVSKRDMLPEETKEETAIE